MKRKARRILASAPISAQPVLAAAVRLAPELPPRAWAWSLRVVSEHGPRLDPPTLANLAALATWWGALPVFGAVAPSRRARRCARARVVAHCL